MSVSICQANNAVLLGKLKGLPVGNAPMHIYVFVCPQRVWPLLPCTRDLIVSYHIALIGWWWYIHYIQHINNAYLVVYHSYMLHKALQDMTGMSCLEKSFKGVWWARRGASIFKTSVCTFIYLSTDFPKRNSPMGVLMKQPPGRFRETTLLGFLLASRKPACHPR